MKNIIRNFIVGIQFCPAIIHKVIINKDYLFEQVGFE